MIDPKQWEFYFPSRRDEDAFALSMFRPGITLLSIFLHYFMTTTLLENIWTSECEIHQWEYQPGKFINSSRFKESFVFKFLAVYIYIQGTERRRDERFPIDKPLRTAIQHAVEYFGQSHDISLIPE